MSTSINSKDAIPPEHGVPVLQYSLDPVPLRNNARSIFIDEPCNLDDRFDHLLEIPFVDRFVMHHPVPKRPKMVKLSVDVFAPQLPSVGERVG